VTQKDIGFYNEMNLEKIGEEAHIVDIKGILEPGRVNIIDIESEKVSWLDLMIEYAFTV